MNEQLKNFLFLAMQKGGNISPQMRQQTQSTGQLPMMQMGNDIQKMNNRQASHYGMFEKGGQQEQIDQAYLSPMNNYSQRVSEFLQNIKDQAMYAVQDEMVDANDAYAEEADAIESEMPMAQYGGMQYTAPMANQQGLNAVNAWMNAAQNTKDMVKPLAQTAGLATGLKGYFGDQAAYEANPFNSAWNPTRLTVTDKQTGEKTVTRARRDGFFSQPAPTNIQAPVNTNTNQEQCAPGTNCFPDNYEYGGQYFQWGGPYDDNYYANGDPEAYDANGNLKPGYVTFTGVPEPMAGSPITPFGVPGMLGQIAGLVRTGKMVSDNLPAPTVSSTEVGPFTGNLAAPASTAASTAGQTSTTVSPSWYSTLLQGTKSQLATGNAADAYGDKGRADAAAYAASQQGSSTDEEQYKRNAIAMGWVNPDGTADLVGYSTPGPDGKAFGFKPGFNPQAAVTQTLPTTTKEKSTEKKGSGSKSGSGSGSGSSSSTTGTTTNTPPAGTVVVKNEDGTESSISPEEAKKREEEKKKKEEGKTTTTTATDTTPKTNTGEIDYLAMLADPTGQNAGGVYRTDKNGNPVPMAFYDPNMRLTGMSADYRNNVASWFRKNKKPGQLKSVSFDFTTGKQSPATQVPSITGPNTPGPVTQGPNVNTSTGAKEVTGLTPNPAFDTTWSTGRQIPTYPGSVTNVPTQKGPVTSMNDLFPNGIEVGPQGNVISNLPTSISKAVQQAPLTERQQKQIDRINARTQRKVGNIQGQGFQDGQRISYDAQSDNNPNVKILAQPGESGPTEPIQGPDGNWVTFDSQGNPHKSMDRETSRKMASRKKYGGILNKAQDGKEVLGLPTNPQFDMNWAPVGQTNVEMSQEFNKQKYGEPIMIDDTNEYTAKYDKNKKQNPFFAPAMLAGLNTIAGAAQNMDAKAKEKQLRGKLSYDQIFSPIPQTSGSQGDWTVNEGYLRPNDYVPVQFQGAGPLMQQGGAYMEGDELYLDEDTIQAILAAGGQIEYLD